MIFAGRAAAATALLPRIYEAPPSPRRDYLLGFVMFVTGDRPESQRLLEQAWSACNDPAD